MPWVVKNCNGNYGMKKEILETTIFRMNMAAGVYFFRYKYFELAFLYMIIDIWYSYCSFSHFSRNSLKMVLHWDNLVIFASQNQAPQLRQLHKLMSDESSGPFIKSWLLAVSACWALALEEFWRQSRDQKFKNIM